MALVESVRHRVNALSLTSGVLGSIDEEEAYVCEVIDHLRFFELPMGVSIYPTEQTPDKLHALGVDEVKFNIEAATRELFAEMSPALTMISSGGSLTVQWISSGEAWVFLMSLWGLVRPMQRWRPVSTGSHPTALYQCLRRLTRWQGVPADPAVRRTAEETICPPPGGPFPRRTGYRRCSYDVYDLRGLRSRTREG